VIDFLCDAAEGLDLHKLATSCPLDQRKMLRLTARQSRHVLNPSAPILAIRSACAFSNPDTLS